MNNLTSEQIKQILDGAPDGATHYATCVNEYIMQTDKGVMVYENGEWDYEIVSYLGVRCLSDLAEILALRERVAELEGFVKHVHKCIEKNREYSPLMSEIKRYKTIAKAVTVLDGGFIAVKEVAVEPCDKGYLVMHTDHLDALNQARIDAVREFAEFVISRNPRSVVSTEVGYRLEHFEQLKENNDE